MSALVVAVVIALAAGCAGSRLLRVLDAEPGRAADRLLVAVAVGNGLLGILGLALAALGALRPPVVWGMLVGLGALGAAPFAEGVGAAYRERRRLRRSERLAAGVCLAIGLAASCMVVAPAITGDQTKYQLAYPKLYAAAGGLVSTPWTFWGQQQFLQNFVFGLAFSVGTETVARLMNALMALLAIGGLVRLVGRHLAPGWQWAAGVLVLSQPMTWSMLRASGSDLAVVAYTVLAVGAVTAWSRAGGASELRAAGLLAGCAGGAKVMGMLTPALLGLFVVLRSARTGALSTVRAAVLFGGLAAVVAAPPYLRNLAEVGNPLHPFAHSIFAGDDWSDEAAAYLAEYYRQYRTERAALRGSGEYEGIEVVRFPWDLTLYPESFERSARSALDVGPLTLAALPAALWVASWHPAARVVVGVGAAYVAVIAGTAWAHPRYVLPGLVLLLAGGLAGLVRLFDRRVVLAVVAFTVAGQLVVTARLASRTWPDQARVALGRMSRDAFLVRYSERYRFWREANRLTGASDRVLVLAKIPHPYFIEGDFVLGSYLEQTRIDYRAMASPAELAAAARRTGATHVALRTSDLGRDADPFERKVVALWRGFAETLPAPLLRQEGWTLYAIAAAEAAG